VAKSCRLRGFTSIGASTRALPPLRASCIPRFDRVRYIVLSLSDTIPSSTPAASYLKPPPSRCARLALRMDEKSRSPRSSCACTRRHFAAHVDRCRRGSLHPMPARMRNTPALRVRRLHHVSEGRPDRGDSNVRNACEGMPRTREAHDAEGSAPLRVPAPGAVRTASRSTLLAYAEIKADRS